VFQELPPAVFKAITDFQLKDPEFVLPNMFSRVAGLDARIRDHIKFQAPPPPVLSAKKGTFPFLSP
jgi:hypothetical protein